MAISLLISVRRVYLPLYIYLHLHLHLHLYLHLYISLSIYLSIHSRQKPAEYIDDPHVHESTDMYTHIHAYAHAHTRVSKTKCACSWSVQIPGAPNMDQTSHKDPETEAPPIMEIQTDDDNDCKHPCVHRFEACL